jgi:hypothetical protein
MSAYVSKSLKEKIATRANFRCEYCLLMEAVSFFTFHIEHIKSVKHGGLSILINLAYCCPDCNYFKGTDLGTFLKGNLHLVRFFNPRIDLWEEHFELQNGSIYGITEIGKATERILKFNDVERLIFRRQLTEFGLYP